MRSWQQLQTKAEMGDRSLSSAGAQGNCARSMRLPDPTPVPYKNRAPMGPENLIQYWGWGLEEGSYGISRLQFCTDNFSLRRKNQQRRKNAASEIAATARRQKKGGRQGSGHAWGDEPKGTKPSPDFR